MRGRTFGQIKRGDIIYQVSEVKPGFWLVLPIFVTDAQRTTTTEVAINGRFGFVLPADADKYGDIYIYRIDAEIARVGRLPEAQIKII